MGFSLPEASVRNFRREVQKHLASGKSLDEVVEFPVKKKGQPLLLPEEIEELIKKFVQNLSLCGSPVNSSIVIAAAKGIVLHKARSLLKENGGSLELKTSWAFSFLSRHGYVKRKGTCTSRKVPDDFGPIKSQYLENIKKNIEDHNIPLSMVINFDQTSTKMVPVSYWTLEVHGSKQIDMVGLDDEREVTALLTVSLTGELLPPQVIYAGKTPRCHPDVSIPPGWNITHSQTHWSTKETINAQIHRCDYSSIHDKEETEAESFT